MIKNQSPINVDKLPQPFPDGEELLWQGSPSSFESARRILHVGVVTLYFGLLLGWRILLDIRDGKESLHILLNSVPLLLSALVAVSLLLLLSWLIARTTVYSITTHRLLMQIGVALPMTVNIPLKKIRSADVLQRSDGSGDIVLSVKDLEHLGYVHFWPHVRSWSVRNPQPSLRALENVEQVATLFSKALHASAGQPERLSLPKTNAASRGDTGISRPSVIVTA